MKTLVFLIEKEMKQILRNSFIPKMILAYPFLLLLIFPWATNFELRQVPISIVNHSNGTYSMRLIEKIKASPSFALVRATTVRSQAFDDVDMGRSSIIMEIPADYDKSMGKGSVASLMIQTNAVDGNRGLLGQTYLQHLLHSYSYELRSEASPLPEQVIEVCKTYLYNSRLDYKSFMTPAFIAIIITLLCGILPSLNIVQEKENGTIQQMNVSPVSKFTFIFSKILPYWLIGILVLSFSIAIVYLVYGLWPKGSVLAIYLISFIFIVSISGMGIIVSNYSQTLQQAMFLVMFFIIVLFLISGLLTSVAAMPRWAQFIAFSNPLTYYIQMLRSLYLKPIGLGEMLYPLASLIGFGVLLNAWAVLSYRKRH